MVCLIDILLNIHICHPNEYKIGYSMKFKFLTCIVQSWRQVLAAKVLTTNTESIRNKIFIVDVCIYLYTLESSIAKLSIR